MREALLHMTFRIAKMDTANDIVTRGNSALASIPHLNIGGVSLFRWFAFYTCGVISVHTIGPNT